MSIFCRKLQFFYWSVDDCSVDLVLGLTFCIAEGWGFEKRLPGGNDEKKYDDKFTENFS